MDIAQQVEGRIVQLVVVVIAVVIIPTLLTLRLILHPQIIRQVKEVAEDKGKLERAGLHLAPQFYIHLQKFEH